MRPVLSGRDAVADVIRACVLQHGLSVSTQQIAEHLGVPEEQLYAQYGTKTRLLAKALGYDQLLPLMQRVMAGPESNSLKEQLREFAEALTVYFIDSLPSAMALWSATATHHSGEGDEISDPRDTAPSAQGRQVLAGWFTRAQESGRLSDFDVHAAAVMFVGACNAPASRLHLGEDLIDVDMYLNGFIDLFYRAIENPV
jgi:AcrR family transcriptional regulator